MPISASNAITAKVRAKLGARLTEKNYNDMLSMSSVSEIAAYLKTGTKYSAVLKDVRESAVHRGNLERLLGEYTLREMSGLCRFERSVGDKMAAVLMRREELRVTLEFLRYLASGHPEDYLLISSAVSDSLVSFDIRKMAASRSLKELAAALSPSPFARVVSGFAKNRSERIDYTLLESVLNRELFKYEATFVSENFSGTTKKELLEIIGIRADLQNAILCYRAKKYYRTDSSLILPQLIEYGRYITKPQRSKMAAAEDGDEALRLLGETRYGEYLKKHGNIRIGELCERIVYKKMLRSMRMSVSPDVVSICYTELMNVEKNNIITIIEGVRYDMPPESIRKMLITE